MQKNNVSCESVKFPISKIRLDIFSFCLVAILIATNSFASQVETAPLTNSLLVLQVDNYGNLTCIGPPDAALVNKSMSECNDISNLSFIYADKRNNSSLFLPELVSRSNIQLKDANHKLSIKINNKNPLITYSYSRAKPESSGIVGLKFKLFKTSDDDEYKFSIYKNYFVFNNDCTKYKIDVGSDFLWSRKPIYTTEKNNNLKTAEVGKLDYDIEILFERTYDREIKIMRSSCLNQRPLKMDNYLVSHFPTNFDFNPKNKVPQNPTEYKGTSFAELDAWIKQLSIHLRNNQYQNTGAIALGLPNQNRSTYWSSFPKEMASYITALTNLGMLAEAKAAIIFLLSSQDPDGGFQTRYYLDGTIYEQREKWPGESDLSAMYLPILLANYYKSSGDDAFLRASYPYIVKSYQYFQSSSLKYTGNSTLLDWLTQQFDPDLLDTVSEYLKWPRLGVAVRANDNQINSKLLTSTSEKWTFSVHASLLGIHSKESFMFISDTLNGIKRDSKTALRDSLIFLLDKKPNIFQNKLIRKHWRHNPTSKKGPKFKLNGKFAVNENDFEIQGPSSYYSSFSASGVLRFGTLEFNLIRENRGNKVQAGFRSVDGKNGIFLQAEESCSIHIRNKGVIKIFEVDGDCPEKLNFSIEWRKDAAILKWLDTKEVVVIPIESELNTVLPAYVNVDTGGSLKIATINYKNFETNFLTEMGHASYDAEALAMGLQIPEYSKPLSDTFRTAREKLNSYGGTISMATGGFAADCGAQHSGTLAAGLVATGELEQGMEILSALYKSRSTFGSLPEYICPPGKNSVSKSASASWTISNTINGYIRSFGLLRRNDGIYLNYTRDFSVLDFKFLGKAYSISVKQLKNSRLNITVNGVDKVYPLDPEGVYVKISNAM